MAASKTYLALGTCLAFVLASAARAEIEGDLGLRADVGLDTNPLRTSGDGPDSSFTQLTLAGNLAAGLAPRTKFFVEGYARQRWHAAEQAEADATNGDLTTGLAVSPLRFGRTRLALTFGAGFGLSRSTYTDPVTGEVALIAVTPPTIPETYVPIPERFDNDALRAFLEARWRLTPRVLATFDAVHERTDFADAPTAATGLESLDLRTLSFEPGLMLKANEKITLGLALRLNDLDYEDQMALDETGASVPGTQREYHHAEGRITLYLSPAAGWKVRFGLSDADRRDVYAGYQDYHSQAGFTTVEHRTRKQGFSLSASLRDLEYERATVEGGSSAELRASEVRSFAGRFDRMLPRGLRWFCEAGTQRVDSRDVEYAYDRDWLMTGFEYRLQSRNKT